MVDILPRPLSILDVGGTQTIWETIGYVGRSDIRITLVNVENVRSTYSNVVSIKGDARDMRSFADKEFDVVYSNSVIEHVGDFTDMRLMATEIQRVGKRFFVQTPYRYFPIEPHFVFPLFQFLPLEIQVSLVQHFSLGWFPRLPGRVEAETVVRSIRLLSKSHLRSLFSNAHFENETLVGITKSLLVWKM